MIERHASFAQLKRDFDQAFAPAVDGAGLFSLGCALLDDRLGGGLALGALHEVCASGEGDHASASGVALAFALRAAGEKPILWVREDKGARMHGALYAPGLAELGAAVERIILVHAPDTLAALRAGADIVGAAGLGAVIIEPFGEAKALDLTASRKLVLAAERGRAGAFILRDRATRLASAAATRWLVASAASVPLPGDAPGHPAFALSLARHRGGIAPFDLTLEWNRDEQSFCLPASPATQSTAPLSGAGLSGVERRQMAA